MCEVTHENAVLTPTYVEYCSRRWSSRTCSIMIGQGLVQLKRLTASLEDHTKIWLEFDSHEQCVDRQHFESMKQLRRSLSDP